MSKIYIPKKIALLLLVCLFGLGKSQNADLEKRLEKTMALIKSQNYDSAIVCADQLFMEAQKNQLAHYQVKALSNKALSLTFLNKPKEAIDLYYKALKLCSDTSFINKAIIYSAIGNINYNQGNYETAKNNYKAEIRIRRFVGDLNKVANNLINLSAMHRRLKEFDSSTILLNEVKTIVNKSKDPKLSAYYYAALGAHYTSLNRSDISKISYLDSANNNYQKSLTIWLKLNNREEALRPLFNIGLIYQLKNDFKKALDNYLKAKNIVETLNLEHEKITVYGNLAELYYDLEDYKKSADYFRDYIELKQSIQKKEINDYALKLDKQFTTEKEVMDYAIKLDKQFQAEKSREIIQQQKLEIHEKGKQLYFLLFISALVLVILLLILVYFNFKKRVQSQIEEAKKKFFSNVVHEIRTPLSMISAPLKLLKPKLNTSEDIYNIELAERNIDRLNELISQMLDISKIESTRYTLSETFGDLEIFFNTLLKTYTKLATEKNIVLIHQLHLHNKITFFDKDALEKITGNLLSNAIKYTPANNQIGIDVYAEEKEAGVNLVINVWDTGAGISEKDQEKIFSRFYRSSETANTTKGVGIGLSLVKDLVELHRGDISLKSVLGKGSIFTVNLTLKTNDDKHNIVVASNSNADLVSQILLVEDDEDILEFNSRLLEKHHFKVLKAKNGKEAILLLEKTLPDLIISDLMMPEMDGLSFLKAIKNNTESDHIPVIILSAKASPESKIEALKLGAQGYLAKPFLPDELITLVINQIEILSKKKTAFKELIKQPEKKTEEKFIGTDPYTQKLFALIFKHLDDSELSVEGLADKMATNRSHFQRKIKSLTGFSPSELVKAVRLEKAKELLLLKSGNITEVAYQTGFSSQSYFTRCFTQHFGVSPTQMLQSNK